MTVLYNDIDTNVGAWLKELIRAGQLPDGQVDTRSIRDLRATDLAGFKQCHFFAGIGGWPLALRWAGLENVPGIWTGSPPCQPFSVAGKRLGKADARHLAPNWLDLIRECAPRLIFGEQVANAIGDGWLDDLFNALEDAGYTCGAAVLPACGVGAPHLRRRLFFGAGRLANADCTRWDFRHVNCRNKKKARERTARRFSHDGEDDLNNRFEFNPPHKRADTNHGGWSCPDWLGRQDGKLRAVESGSQPLAHGVSARVGRLRGYGNAIVPQLASVFVRSFIDAIAAAHTAQKHEAG